jgi:hypothetical protein
MDIETLQETRAIVREACRRLMKHPRKNQRAIARALDLHIAIEEKLKHSRYASRNATANK